MVFLYATAPEYPFQPSPAERSDATAIHIVFNPREPCAQMILLTACEIFQPIFIFNRNDKSAALRQMWQKNVEEILIRCLSTDITLSVFKYTDQADVVIILRQLRLNVLKISHMNCNIVTFAVPVGIDETALLRQIHAGHASRLPRQCPGDRPTATSDLENLVRFLHRNPVHDIFPQRRQMIKDRPAPALLYNLCILDR